MTTSLQSTLPNLLAFCASYESRSFSAAARQLGVTPQAASRAIVRLEDTLRVALFRRTTRTVIATEAAHAYYQTAKQALELLRQAEQHVSCRSGTGGVRVSVPTTFAHHLLLPALPAFRASHPGVEVEIDVSNRNVDFAVEGYDLAVRLGQIRDQGLIARRIAKFPLGVYGAPAYLARRTAPRVPQQLVDHLCIVFTMPSSGRVLPWTFAPSPRSWIPKIALRCSGDPLATISLARAGLGLVQTYDFVVVQDVKRGLLVEVLRECRGASRPFSIVYPASPKRSHAAHALIEFIVALGTRTRHISHPVFGSDPRSE